MLRFAIEQNCEDMSVKALIIVMLLRCLAQIRQTGHNVKFAESLYRP